jgi:hypothetical protein
MDVDKEVNNSAVLLDSLKTSELLQNKLNFKLDLCTNSAFTNTASADALYIHFTASELCNCINSPFVIGHGAGHDIFGSKISLATMLSVLPMKLEVLGRRVRLNFAVDILRPLGQSMETFGLHPQNACPEHIHACWA